MGSLMGTPLSTWAACRNHQEWAWGSPLNDWHLGQPSGLMGPRVSLLCLRFPSPPTGVKSRLVPGHADYRKACGSL